MDVVLRNKFHSKLVSVSETDSISSLKETFIKFTGEAVPNDVSYQDKFGNELSPKLTLKQAGIRSGDVIFIVRSRNNHLQHIIVLSLLLALFLIGVCALTLFYKFSKVQPFDVSKKFALLSCLQYAMVFDAGSSHTELKVFQWQSNKFRGTGLVKEIHSCEMKGGIGETLRGNPGKSGEYLQGCLEEGLSIIPMARRGHSPVFLAATAGMRLLKLEDPQATSEIMGNTSRVLQSTGMLFYQTNVRIISGKEEAVSLWVSANYLLQSLLPKPGFTIGTLDLGGASTQIAFAKNDDAPPSVTDVLLKLYGEEYDVAALSYLCFGQSQIYNRYLITLLEGTQQGMNVTITSPCHNDGYRKTIKYDSLRSPCTTTTNLPSFPGLYVTVIGKYNHFACEIAVNDLLSPEKCQSNFAKEFCFSKPPKHDPNTSYIATSGFYFTVLNLNVTAVNGTLSEFVTAGKNHCGKPWESVIKSNDSAFQTEIKTKLCFNSHYNRLLLTNGYGFNNETWSKISFINTINGTGFGWQLGFAIASTNSIPEEGTIDRFPSDIFAGILFVLAFIIGACFTLLTARILVKMRLKTRGVSPSGKERSLA